MKMTPDDLRDAINYTAQRTGFSSSLIEKDYYCSLVLQILYANDQLKDLLIFKGGTLLSKCYFSFFRMSEDLDFSISNTYCASRNDRKNIATVFKTVIPVILNELNFKEVSPFRGYNESRQYSGIFGYESVIGPSDTIKFDVGLRGDIMLDPVQKDLKTLLKDPITDKDIYEQFSALTLTTEEVFAEKFRAALTRDPCAIRDFYDVEKISDSGFKISDKNFAELVKRKIAFVPSASIDLTLEKKKNALDQIDSDLKPVLMSGSLFSLDKSWSCLQDFTKNYME